MVSVVCKGACMGIRSGLHSDECLRVVPRLGRAASYLTIVPQSRCACTDLVCCNWSERVVSSDGRPAPLRSGSELFGRLTLYYGIGLMLGAYAHWGIGTKSWSKRSDDPVLRAPAVVAGAREDGRWVSELRAG